MAIALTPAAVIVLTLAVAILLTLAVAEGSDAIGLTPRGAPIRV